MIRSLHLLSVLVIASAVGVFALCVVQWTQKEPPHDPLLGRPGAVEAFTQSAREIPLEEKERLSPLLTAASAFAAHLNPPVPPKPQAVAQEAPKLIAPAVRPPTSTPKFKLCGTSCCDDQPERSMALIMEPGSNGAAQWVKRGTQVGHFVIQEIRPGSVVYREGEQVQEMAIDREIVAATATATSSDSIGSANFNSRMAAKTDAVPLPDPTKRPARSKSMTVGSARTAALD